VYFFGLRGGTIATTNNMFRSSQITGMVSIAGTETSLAEFSRTFQHAYMFFLPQH
jgi:hypothetical protein